MPSETWTSCSTSQKALLEAVLFWGFHTRGPWYLLAADRSCDKLKGTRGRARSHRKGHWLNTGPRSPGKGEGLACADQEELISRDIIELYINNVPEKRRAELWLSEESERVKNMDTQLAAAGRKHDSGISQTNIELISESDMGTAALTADLDAPQSKHVFVYDRKLFWQIPTWVLRNIKKWNKRSD